MIVAGIFIGLFFLPSTADFASIKNNKQSSGKIADIIQFIENEYVDTINATQLVDNTIEQMMQQLDPHSAYIPASDLKQVNEPLRGNFEGIGIEFHISRDTVMVVNVIAGGPSANVGLMAGDRIVKVDGKNFYGPSITNDTVLKTLRGQGGTKVKLAVYRSSANKLINYVITRGKIPIYSIDAAYMADAKTGYIRMSRFGEKTYDEYMQAFEKLKANGMQQLILDLRGNGGGFLEIAQQIADEFLTDGKMIVYTAGRKQPRKDYKATSAGNFETGKLAILIDEGSASASEIVAGAVQDLDRGTIIGRRSFGKGLVQQQTELSDGSALRLTIARYYTPTGRSIQKAYSKGYEAYENDLLTRYDHGELLNADSIKFNDTLKFKTPAGKIVYGGGGIMPDVFVPIDTIGRNRFTDILYASGAMNEFCYKYVDDNRSILKNQYNENTFVSNFNINDAIAQKFKDYLAKQEITTDEKSFTQALKYTSNQMKAIMGRQLFNNEVMYKVLQTEDKALNKALQILND